MKQILALIAGLCRDGAYLDDVMRLCQAISAQVEQDVAKEFQNRSQVRIVNLAPVLAFLRSNQKIQAIKEVRAQTGSGLRESKDFCDALDAAIKVPF